MFSFMFIIAFFMFMLWIGFKLTGAMLAAIIWLCIRLPLGLMAISAGVACCCTIIFIPVGLWFFKAGVRVLVPGCLAY